ncbi:hypothetical protein [Piscibacillus halophilus]|uniref:hypothetical protein n=1 Tax=Piscibacillus halophilus TaxID=571933 RepID=UPI001589EE14|nr:hypothetical protein [Piscibacillus halophilus]
MEITDPYLIDKAKAYKKIFESYEISPTHLNYNGKDYYLVTYIQKLTKKTELAIISNNDSSIGESDFAFEKLMIILNFLNSILVKGSDRSRINMEAYKVTSDFLKNVLGEVNLDNDRRKHYQYALESLEKVLTLHDQHNETIQETKKFMKNRGNKKLYIEDLNLLEDLISELDYIQYQILLTSLNMVDSFKYINDDIKDNRISRFTNNDIKKYIKEYIKSESTIKQEIKKVNYVDGLDQMTKEEHKSAVIKKYYKEQEKDFVKLKKEVRNL